MHKSIPRFGRRRLVAVAASVAITSLTLLSGSVTASAKSNGYTLFGDATLVSPGFNSPTAAQASYDGVASFGGVDFSQPSGLTVSQLTNLSTDYQFTVGSCQDGAPRLVATVTDGTHTGNINFYVGPPPSYTGCPPNAWSNTGNLASAINLVDTSQLPGGTFYDPYFVAQVKYGSYTITDLFVVVDGFSVTPSTAQFDNVTINSTIYTFENANSCKKGGWQQFTSSPGPFKNQGDCVSYFASGGKNG
jgi:hypothetical protein